MTAALRLFLDRGFGPTTMNMVAGAAGVAKGSIYLYFSSKEALLRAAILEVTGHGIESLIALEGGDAPVSQLLRMFVAELGILLTSDPVPALIHLVVTESRALPDVAAIWHDAVPKPVIAAAVRLISKAQARGEVVPGDPRIHALSLVGPLVMSTIFREVFSLVSEQLPEPTALARQHTTTILEGLLA